jgi:hypothetical protein
MRIANVVIAVLSIVSVPCYAQYGLDFGCLDDTVKIAFDTSSYVVFYFYLQNTGSLPDSYALDCRIIDSVPGWDEMFCVGGNCGVPGMILYDHLNAGAADSNIDVQVFLNPNYGIETINLKVNSVGDPGTHDSVNVHVKKEVNIRENRNAIMPGAGTIRFEAFPNPFSEFVNIRVSPGIREPAVSLCVLDCTGRQVRDLSNKIPLQGDAMITWDGTDNSHEKVNCGVFFLRLIAGNETKIKKQLYMPQIR